MNNKTQIFLEHVESECKKHNIKLKLKSVTYLKISNKIRCSGYFDDVVGELVVAIKKDEETWLSILAHEYAHLTQWVENCPEWREGCKGLTKVDNWLLGENIYNIKKSLAQVRELELDNEKRTVKLIKKFGLPIDLNTYIKKANAYVFFYTYLFETRKWSSPKNSPYNNKAILNIMPNKFLQDYSILPNNIHNTFVEQKI